MRRSLVRRCNCLRISSTELAKPLTPHKNREVTSLSDLFYKHLVVIIFIGPAKFIGQRTAARILKSLN